MNEIVVIETKDLTPAIFSDHDAIDKIVSDIEAQVRATPVDISTAKGRKECASLAFKVARSKTALDEMGKSLVSGLKSQSKLIDAERAKVWDRLEALQSEVRKPLDEYEATEASRIVEHQNAIQAILDLGRAFDVESPGSPHVIARLMMLGALPERNWHEFQQRATSARAETFAKLTALKESALKREAEVAELDRLRAEQVARERQERDDRIAAEAAARATKEAEERAANAAKAVAAAAAAERLRIDSEKIEAVAAQRRAEREAAKAIQKAEDDRRHLAEASETNRLMAIEAERKRVADLAAAEAAETRRRETDKAHRKSVNSEALAALVSAGLTVEHGIIAITAIVKRQIPHIRIDY